ncbi:hypothetical protein [Methylobacterium bullatum]|uniref:Uncharacterized protein n=2 Tax=Methylobacterium bullatum TaxID=570505 RepID=A0AAV4ZBM0_9HYPH|nr:hypothetical protein [Methylobacterium bullatum]MBD8902809.1 hypothetical protein [Methylobacterium bullatum]GJD41280.1 hypothetical protein OICFNHDK_3763 [Methylobacterium bullatum]
MTPYEAAAIVRQTADEMRLKPGMARLAIEIAARAIERGRHFTDAEKLEHLRAALLEDGDDVEGTDRLVEALAEKTDILQIRAEQ